ncbi:hypothetical protein J6590_064335 [Homalodisca vitripennis]|nr:hypothetical protein J6590_064335 [Homalodisca vitripennis]
MGLSLLESLSFRVLIVCGLRCWRRYFAWKYLDELKTEAEVDNDVKSVLGGTTRLKTFLSKANFRGQKTAIRTLGDLDVAKLLAEGHIKIGWVRCREREKLTASSARALYCGSSETKASKSWQWLPGRDSIPSQRAAFSPSIVQGILDISFSCEKIAHYISDWHVCENYSASYHQAILFKVFFVQANPDASSDPLPRRYVSKQALFH